MYIIIAFACIYLDSIEVSGQILIMHICYNDRNLDFNLILALCDLLQYIYIHIYIVFFFSNLKLPPWRELQDVQRCREMQRHHQATRIPENAQSCDLNVGREFFLRPDLCLGSVLRQWVDSTSSCIMYNSTRVSVKVVQVIVVKFLVTKNQSRCLNFQNNSTHVQHTCMHTFLLLFLVGMITYWVMQTRLEH